MNDSKNLILAVVLSALVLLGWSLLSEQLFPTAEPAGGQGRGRQGEAAAAAAGRSRSPQTPQGDAQPGRRASARPRACASRRRSLQGSINLKGARIDDLVLFASGRRSPRIRRRCGCCRRSARRGAYFASFGWSRPGRRRRPTSTPCGPPTAPVLSPGPARDIELDQAAGRRFASKSDLGRRRLSLHRQAARRSMRPAKPVVRSADRARQPSRPSRPTPTAGRPRRPDRRSSTARPITTSTGRPRRGGPSRRSTNVAAGSASPTNIG